MIGDAAYETAPYEITLGISFHYLEYINDNRTYTLEMDPCCVNSITPSFTVENQNAAVGVPLEILMPTLTLDNPSAACGYTYEWELLYETNGKTADFGTFTPSSSSPTKYIFQEEQLDELLDIPNKKPILRKIILT